MSLEEKDGEFKKFIDYYLSAQSLGDEIYIGTRTVLIVDEERRSIMVSDSEREYGIVFGRNSQVVETEPSGLKKLTENPFEKLPGSVRSILDKIRRPENRRGISPELESPIRYIADNLNEVDNYRG